MMAIEGIDVEPDVLQDYVKLCERILSKDGPIHLTKFEKDTLILLKFYAERKLDHYNELARVHIKDRHFLDEIKKEYKTEFLIGYGLFFIGCFTILMLIF